MKNTEKSVEIKSWTLLNYLPINVPTEFSVLIKFLLLKKSKNLSLIHKKLQFFKRAVGLFIQKS